MDPVGPYRRTQAHGRTDRSDEQTTDGRTDGLGGQTDGRTDGRTDERTGGTGGRKDGIADAHRYFRNEIVVTVIFGMYLHPPPTH
jgi:hypothetical protein